MGKIFERIAIQCFALAKRRFEQPSPFGRAERPERLRRKAEPQDSERKPSAPFCYAAPDEAGA